jgi:hypothetical protein
VRTFGKPRPRIDEPRPLNYFEYTWAGLPPCTWIGANPVTGDIEFLKVGAPPGILVPLQLSPRALHEARAGLIEYWGERNA